MTERKRINLGPRLEACAAMVREGSVMADIGTDHAKLPVHLVGCGICKRAIASDIAKKPYEGALLFVKENGLTDSIDVRLGAGLDKIDPDEVTDIVIAGMGGELIAQILEAAPWTGDGGYNLILQPMSKASVLRGWLIENGFSIESETAVTDSGRDYTVINSRYTGEKRKPERLEIYVGRLVPCRNESARRLLIKQANLLKNEAIGLSHNGDAENAQKYLETAEELIKLSEE